MDIQRTESRDIPTINNLISASKKVWDYDDAYLREALPLLKIDDKWLLENLCFTIEDNGICGFIGLEVQEDGWFLDHLWIRPDRMRQGLGRDAIQFILNMARDYGVRSIRLFPDPPAEGFYERMGAHYTGKTVPSRVASGPLFREMSFQLGGPLWH